ncbi:MAG: glycosyltransferase family 4 protein, partial [Marinilabiliaceae bacterium]|nr:glycosyltransferase family 4 protein [Marinilabiliaceae bacterium]
EKLKQPIVRSFDGFIAAGKRATAYLQTFDINVPVTQPWDVVDNDYFEQQTGSKPQGLPDEYILCASRFIHKKNHLTLLEGFNQFKKNTTTATKLVLIGSGPLKKEIQKSISDLKLQDDVVMFDFVQYDELPQFYKHSKALILPSLSDQWGLVVNEAMACGKPVIVSNRCGCADDLVVNGENGWVIEPTAQGIAESLQQLAATDSETLHQMGQNSLKRLNGFGLDDFSKAVTRLVTDYNLKSNQHGFNRLVLLRNYL